MARRKKKSNSKLLFRWILVLTSVLILMAVFAMTLKRNTAPSKPQTTTEPTHALNSTTQSSEAPSPTTKPEPTLGSNPYGPEDFGYDKNGYLTCLSGGSIPGIDVSSYQGKIDWPAVKAGGIEFVIIRAGYRGYTSGTLHADERALQNIADAKAAGLKVGAYFFSQAVSAEEAREEARFVLDLLEGVELDLPMVYDWEYISETARTGNMDPKTLTACMNAFCAEIDGSGFDPMVYFNVELTKTLLDVTKLTEYPLWLAMYSDQMTFPYKINFWQYSNTGRVPGIKGNVDLNLYFP